MSLEWLSASIALVSIPLSIIAALSAAALRSSARKLRSLQSDVVILKADCAELHEILVRLDARDRMRRVRAAKPDDSSSSQTPLEARPDPHTDPVGWKRWMRNNHPLGAR
jgi:hypothetical protein